MSDFDQSKFDQTSCLTYFVLYIDQSKEGEFATSDWDSNRRPVKAIEAIQAAVKQYRQANEARIASTRDQRINLLLQLNKTGYQDYTATVTETFESVKTPGRRKYATIAHRSRDGLEKALDYLQRQMKGAVGKDRPARNGCSVLSSGFEDKVNKALSSPFETARKGEWATLEEQLRTLELTVQKELSAMSMTFKDDLNALSERDLSVTGSGTFFESEPYPSLEDGLRTALARGDYDDAYQKISQIKETLADSDFWPGVPTDSTEV